MIFANPTLSVPLTTDDSGVVRIANTRIPLEAVVELFQSGETPEQIVEAYPVLHLDDVYAVFTYCLKYPAEIELYLRELASLAAKARSTALEIAKPPLTRAELRRRALNATFSHCQ